MIKDNQKKYLKLRKEYKTFIYESFHYEVFQDFIKISFNFSLDSLIALNKIWLIYMVNKEVNGAYLYYV